MAKESFVFKNLFGTAGISRDSHLFESNSEDIKAETISSPVSQG